MPYYGYMVYQAERARTPAEHREADEQLGRTFAALTHLHGSLAGARPGDGRRPQRRRAAWRNLRRRLLRLSKAVTGVPAR
jgi:hypothetical protein